MAVSVIGAGFGRTGTESMRRALEMLGFGPCHHMLEVIQKAELQAKWRDVVAGGPRDWEDILAGYHSTVDWPTTHYWRELSQHYPTAKVVLTVRDPEAWYRSMENTILPVLRESTDKQSVGVVVIREELFQGRLDDKDFIIQCYLDNIDEVQKTFGPDRLLTYELGSGWDPLCNFLDCNVPDEPYPSGNAPAEFHKTVTANNPR